MSIESFKLFTGFSDQHWLIAVIDVYPNLSIQETVDFDKSTSEFGSSGVVFDSLMVRHWDKWGVYNKRNHLFLCPVDVLSDGLILLDNNKFVDMMKNLEIDCPRKAISFSDDDYAISSDGKYLSFVSTQCCSKQSKEFAWSTDFCVYLLELPVSAKSIPETFQFKVISDASLHSAHCSPKFSPDNNLICYQGMKRSQYESDQTSIYLYDITKSKVVYSSEDISLSFGTVEWIDDSLSGSVSFYSVAQYKAISRIFRFSLAVNGESNNFSLSSIEMMTGDNDCSRSSPVCVNLSILQSKNECVLYYLESSLTKPNEIKSTNFSNEKNTTFTAFSLGDIYSYKLGKVQANDCEIKSLQISSRYIREIYCGCPQYVNGDKLLSEPEQHYFHGANDELVHAWYLPPVGVDFDSQHKVPLLLIVHGG